MSQDQAGPLDLSMLDELRELEAGTGTALIDELVADWKASAERTVVGIDAAIEAGDLQEVSQLAHGLVGSSGTVAAAVVASTCRSLVEAAIGGDLAGISEARARLSTELHQALDALEAREREVSN